MAEPRSSVIHLCPEPCSGITGCCEKPVFELPVTDRLTLDAELVTCFDTDEVLWI